MIYFVSDNINDKKENAVLIKFPFLIKLEKQINKNGSYIHKPQKVRHDKKLRGNIWIRGGSFLLMMSIILATMFLKQHSMLDVIAGTLLVDTTKNSVIPVNRKIQY